VHITPDGRKIPYSTKNIKNLAKWMTYRLNFWRDEGRVPVASIKQRQQLSEKQKEKARVNDRVSELAEIGWDKHDSTICSNPEHQSNYCREKDCDASDEYGYCLGHKPKKIACLECIQEEKSKQIKDELFTSALKRATDYAKGEELTIEQQVSLIRYVLTKPSTGNLLSLIEIGDKKTRNNLVENVLKKYPFFRKLKIKQLAKEKKDNNIKTKPDSKPPNLFPFKTTPTP
jgi:hypothetical protein